MSSLEWAGGIARTFLALGGLLPDVVEDVRDVDQVLVPVVQFGDRSQWHDLLLLALIALLP